jgi:hypothetical protein
MHERTQLRTLAALSPHSLFFSNGQRLVQGGDTRFRSITAAHPVDGLVDVEEVVVPEDPAAVRRRQAPARHRRLLQSRQRCRLPVIECAAGLRSRRRGKHLQCRA